jgi:hypothetical protein
MRTTRRSWRAAAAVVAVALVAMVAGAALRGAGEQPSTAAPDAGTASPQANASPGRGDSSRAEEGAGPRALVDGVGMGFARDEAGAVAAAVSYATAAQNWLYLSEDQVTESAGAVTVPEVRDRLVGELVDQVRLLRDELVEASRTVWFVMAPLATRVDTYSPERAVVRVWLVRVLSADGVAVPQSGWQTLRFELVWHEGDWRIAETADVEGPTPQLEAGLQPWSARYLDQELEGFTRIGATP